MAMGCHRRCSWPSCWRLGKQEKAGRCVFINRGARGKLNRRLQMCTVAWNSTRHALLCRCRSMGGKLTMAMPSRADGARETSADACSKCFAYQSCSARAPDSSVNQRPRRCSRPTPQNRNRRSCEKHMELTHPLTSTLHSSFIPKLSAPNCSM